MSILCLVVLALIGEAIWETLKMTWQAGKISVKWYKFEVKSDKEREKIRNRLESSENNYNSVYNVDFLNIHSPIKYTCIKNGKDRYIMRILIPSGTKTVGNGVSVSKYTNISNVVVTVDLAELYIEIRANYINAKRIIDYVSGSLSIENVIEVDILKRYNNSIEEFKNALYNGKFIETLGIPDINITLDHEKSELLANVLEIMDDYFLDKNINNLKKRLSNINIDTEDMPFTQLLLAGMSKIGIGMRDDIDDDLSGQTLYKAFNRNNFKKN